MPAKQRRGQHDVRLQYCYSYSKNGAKAHLVRLGVLLLGDPSTLGLDLRRLSVGSRVLHLDAVGNIGRSRLD